jgi:hypothetical protein
MAWTDDEQGALDELTEAMQALVDAGASKQSKPVIDACKERVRNAIDHLTELREAGGFD